MKLYFDYSKEMEDSLNLMNKEDETNTYTISEDILSLLCIKDTKKHIDPDKVKCFVELTNQLNEMARIQGGKLDVIQNDNETFGRIIFECVGLFITSDKHDLSGNAFKRAIEECDSIVIKNKNGNIEFDIIIKFF